jgi:alkanesulfonate monooxygenase SsuD/methylene tetrahydromethanopterin reductase-like flavin-dependent oxidoreductase (luciferase family)
MTIPLSVLDLVPMPSGTTAAEALATTVDLAQRTEAAGYHRYWIAEHHLNPGVAGTMPALVIQHVAAATTRIRVGAGAVQMGHHTPLAVVEQYGLLDALHPGRIDLGLGRSIYRRPAGGRPREDGERRERPSRPTPEATWTPEGLLLPPPFSLGPLLRSPRFRLQGAMMQQPGAETPDYAEQVDEVLALLAGTYHGADGTEAHVVPGEGADVEMWILGSSGGVSAEVAGARGLRFAANYHISPSAVVEAVDAYRAAFRPSPGLDRPHVAVSADVVVAATDEEAAELAGGYALWVRSIRSAEGAIPFPSPDEARRHRWTGEERALVADRVDTQFTGSPATVAGRLDVLARATGADELVVTTITHDHADRVRSYELLAAEWARRAAAAAPAEGDARC